MKDALKFDKASETAQRWVSVARSGPWYALARNLVLRKGRPSTATPIVQPSSVAGRALTVVIAIMCFLGCLTVGAVKMVHQSADEWFADIASEVTVQIAPVEADKLEETVTRVVFFLAKQQGVRGVTPLTPEESGALLEPWLGSSDALSELPVPRLIEVEIDRKNPPDMSTLRASLSSNFANVTLDDHRRWRAELKTVTRSLVLGGFTVLMLVAAATVASIVSATKSAMASNREIIEVLHFVGAQERFIAHEFEKHFLSIGIRAGLVGALAATVVFLVLPLVMRLLGGGGLAAAEIRQLIGTTSLGLSGYLLFALVVVVVATLCMVTSRFGVYRILKSTS